MRIMGIVLAVVVLAWLVYTIGGYRTRRRLRQQREEALKAVMRKLGKEVNIGKAPSWAFWLMCISFVLCMSCVIYLLVAK